MVRAINLLRNVGKFDNVAAGAQLPFDRLSLTIPALLDSDQLLFVIRGADKRALFEEAAAGANDLPVARLLAAARQPVTCFT